MNESPTLRPAGDAGEHALRMDRMYRYQRHIYDLTRKYYLLGRDHLIDNLDIPAGGSVLEVGCGTGRNLARTRRLYPTAKLYGLDISSAMLATARAKFDEGSRAPQLQVGDATSFRPQDFGASGFDRVMISYALSMIPDWPAAIDRGIEALGPAGSLHVVDFGQQERLPPWFRTALQAWLARFHVTPRADLRAALEQRAKASGLQLGFKPLWQGYAWYAVLKR
jgi:S-adenosylmethionine-diacylgycerolhomoserine-N-methlytransferase